MNSRLLDANFVASVDDVVAVVDVVAVNGEGIIYISIACLYIIQSLYYLLSSHVPEL